MSKETFAAAFRRAIRHDWPNATDEETNLAIAENYVGARHGHPDYDWSASAARELARLYVADFGEARE